MSVENFRRRKNEAKGKDILHKTNFDGASKDKNRMSMPKQATRRDGKN